MHKSKCAPYKKDRRAKGAPARDVPVCVVVKEQKGKGARVGTELSLEDMYVPYLCLSCLLSLVYLLFVARFTSVGPWSVALVALQANGGWNASSSAMRESWRDESKPESEVVLYEMKMIFDGKVNTWSCFSHQLCGSFQKALVPRLCLCARQRKIKKKNRQRS